MCTGTISNDLCLPSATNQALPQDQCIVLGDKYYVEGCVLYNSIYYYPIMAGESSRPPARGPLFLAWPALPKESQALLILPAFCRHSALQLPAVSPAGDAPWQLHEGMRQVFAAMLLAIVKSALHFGKIGNLRSTATYETEDV